MLDETTPADNSADTGAEGTADAVAAAAAPDPGGEARPAKKAAAKKAPAKKAAAKKAPARKVAAKTPVAEIPVAAEEALAFATSAPDDAAPEDAAPAKKAPARRTRKTAAKKVAEAPVETPSADDVAVPAADGADGAEPQAPAKRAAAKKAPARKAAAKKAPAKKATAKKTAAPEVPEEAAEVLTEVTSAPETPVATQDDSGTLPLFQAPEAVKKAPARRTRKRAAAAPVEEVPVEKTAIQLAEEAALAAEEAAAAAEVADEVAPVETTEERETPAPDAAEDAEGSDSEGDDEDDSEDGTPARRRRRRGGRRRRRSGDSTGQGNEDSSDADSEDGDASEESEENPEGQDGSDSADGESGSSSSRRRRRRRRSGDNDSETPDDPENTVVRVRKTRSAEDQITSLAGSTRLEAKKQRRREGREAGRRRAPIVSEAEFLARREAVERVMVVRQRQDLTQIAVLEDKVLVEHYVARESQTSLIGNVYLGRVQNVLPSMEAAFIDIGKGRNAVLYAGEVNWSALGHKDGQARKIESVLSPGQPVLVQVSKDPIGHKGARLTSQISLAGRFLVYVPDGTTSGISRKLPDTERSRLKALLKEIVPDSAGVIVRTAAEGASEEELTQDVERLKARWEDIESKGRGNAPQLLYGEPDLTLKVVRDLFTEDFTKLVIEGDEAWETVSNYVQHVAPDLADRLERYAPGDNASAAQGDSFTNYRIDEQIAKGLDRKVWLPSGGSLVIDRTEAMTVVDVNTGKFTGSGGNLEETVTKNNLEAAEEIVRQLRLRDIGGIIVVDFIDMVLESNRDLVVRRMVECLGRDRTRHQVAEVTSLGLVQMTRKRIGTGLLESFSTDCDHCQGRGVLTHSHPIEAKQGGDDDGRRGGRRGRGRGESKNDASGNSATSGNGRSADSAGNDGASEGRRQQKSESVDGTVEEAVATSGQSGQREQSGQRREGDNQRSGRRRSRGGQGSVQQSESTEPVGSSEDESAAAAPSVREPRTSVETPAVETPVSPAPVTPAPAVETPAPDAPGTQPSAAEAPAADAPVDTKPRLVTSTRRRGASRGVTAASSEPVAIVVEQAPAAPAVEAQGAPLGDAIRPKVVTRTRGRAASTGDAPSDAAENADSALEPTVEHVPVKKKGARKR